MFEVLEALDLSVVYFLFVFNVHFLFAGVCVCVCVKCKAFHHVLPAVWCDGGAPRSFTHPPTPSLPFSVTAYLSFPFSHLLSSVFTSPLVFRLLPLFLPHHHLSLPPALFLSLCKAQRPEVFESIDSCGCCCCCYTPSMDGHEYFIWGERKRERERERAREEGNGGGRLKEEWEKNERVETGVMERNSLRAIGTSEDKEGTNVDGEEKESERKAGEDRARWRVGELR